MLVGNLAHNCLATAELWMLLIAVLQTGRHRCVQPKSRCLAIRAVYSLQRHEPKVILLTFHLQFFWCSPLKRIII